MAKRFTEDWGLFEWFCLATTVIVLGGILVYSIWVLNGIGGIGGVAPIDGA
jgi:hypothetical protein